MAERIVVVRANNIGDLLLAVPALRALRRARPLAEISLVALPKVRPIVERLGQLVDRYLEFPGFPGIRDRDFDPRASLDFLRRAQDERFDLAIQLQGNGVWTNPFTALLGARSTVGFIRPEDSAHFLGLDLAVPWPAHEHEIRRCLRLMEEIGIEPAGLAMELPTRQEDEDEALGALERAGVDAGRPLLCIHPAGRFENRTWPAEQYVEAAAAIADRIGAAIVVTGGPKDEAVARTVASAAGGTSVGGQLSLPALAALYRRSALVIGNDSGPAHVAVAVGTPSVTVYGAASPVEWGPLDRTHHAVVEADDACHPCPGEPCILRIPTAAVVDAAAEILSTTGIRTGTDGSRSAPSPTSAR
jgi:ADP-heptose:LPS heptosyltransferase